MATTLKPVSVPQFAQAQLRLLLQEHEAEVSSSALASTAASVSASTRRTLQATGYALTGLVLAQCRTGLGGRLVGEFTADPAVASPAASGGGSNSCRTDSDDGRARLGSHGIRVGDIVRVNDVAAAKEASKRSGRGKMVKDASSGPATTSKAGPEGVVTRVGDRSVWVAFGQRGGGGRSKEDDEAVEELWGKKLWLYVLSVRSSALV